MNNIVRNALCLAITLLALTAVHAQKIDPRLTQLVRQSTLSLTSGQVPANVKTCSKTIAVNWNADGTLGNLSAVATLVPGAQCPKVLLEQMGIEVCSVIGDMVALSIPADKLAALEQVREFRCVRAEEQSRVMNDKAREAAGVSKVNTEAAAKAQQLPKAYTGVGVVLGIIDKGIDFNHAAFRDNSGKTRIRKAINFMKEKGKPYTTEEEINALTTDCDVLSHGSHTASIAGGSDTGNGQQGMAPQADLVLCGLGPLGPPQDISKCIKEIFDYAQSVDKPAVVSISLGGITGLHDGSDIVAKAVAELTENGTKKGRAVIISTGNSAANCQSIVKVAGTADAQGYHLKTVLGAATYPTAQAPKAQVLYNGRYYFYAKDYKEFTMKLGLVNVKTGEVMTELGDNVLNQDGEVKSSSGVLTEDWTVSDIKGNDVTAYEINLEDDPLHMKNSDLRLALFVKATKGQQINMMCSGDHYLEPCFDAPTNKGYDFVKAGYTKGNGDMTCNTSVCNDCVISVGSYVTRNSWEDYLKGPHTYEASTLTGKVQALGEISDFSGYCVAETDKAYPTVIAPGHGLIAACNSYDKSFFAENQPGEIDNTKSVNSLCGNVEKNGRANWYMIERGTSMATPAVAGIIALWMQANPNLTVNDIKAILKATCVNDEFTTNVAKIPSGNKVQAGLGKIDCLAGLKKIVGTTAIETVGADGHREATPATMYSVDAPVYNMMGQRVGKNQKGVVIYKGRKYLNR